MPRRPSSCVLRLLFVGIVGGACASGTLTAALQNVIDARAHQDNVSYSFAVVGDESASGELSAAVVAGFDDRASGLLATTESRYPVGSVTKPYTAVAAMRLREQGRLDLDAPVHIILDPFFAAQALPSLQQLWGNDSAVNKITSRHLLGMQSGLGDYDDLPLQNWTINHPSQDYLPMNYLEDLNKHFLFDPGQGAAYSSDGFVLMGYVLTAVTGGKEWSDFDQLGALGTVSPPWNGTTFTGAGPCSLHKGIVHQYAMCRPPGCLNPENPAPQGPTPAPTPGTCTGVRSGEEIRHGSVYETVIVKSVAECCSAAFEIAQDYPCTKYSYVEPACTIFLKIYPPVYPNPNATTGWACGAQKPLVPSSFADLYTKSCANTWTAGNLAATPRDIARFFFLLDHGKLVSAHSLQQMRNYHNFSAGFKTGGGYGLGLFDGDGNRDNPTQTDVTGAVVNWTYSFGHAGADWGSTSYHNGYYPNLGVGMALATNAAHGMNFTTGTAADDHADNLYCELFNVVLNFVHPNTPALNCSNMTFQ